MGEKETATNTLGEIKNLLKKFSGEVIMTREELKKEEEYKPGAFDKHVDLHDGQLKLALNEYLALSLALIFEKNKLPDTDSNIILQHTVVLYIGAASGAESHLKKLASCFKNVKFHLYDPKLMDVDTLNEVNKEFETKIKTKGATDNEKQFSFHQQFFRDKDVECWKKWKAVNPQCILFVINDIRSCFDWPLYYERRKMAIDLLQDRENLQEKYPDTYRDVVEDLMEQNRLHAHELETVVYEDTINPQIWAVQMGADYFLSKVRDPWEEYWKTPNKQRHEIVQLQGMHLLQAFARNSSTEVRLFVVKDQPESSRFMDNREYFELELDLNNVNDVEIEPYWAKTEKPLDDFKWLIKMNERLQKYASEGSGYRCSGNIQYEEIENTLFAYNKSREGGTKDNAIKAVIQDVLNEFISSFDTVEEHTIRNPRFHKFSVLRRRKHEEKKIVKEGKSAFNSEMGNLELAFVSFVKNKDSFWTQWNATPIKQKGFEVDLSSVFDNIKESLQDLMKDPDQYKNQEDYKGVCKAPVYYTEQHPKWKLHILTLMHLNPTISLEVILNNHDWDSNYTLAQLQYYFIDFGLTDSLKSRQEDLYTRLREHLFVQRTKAGKCFMPGVITTYHENVLVTKMEPDFFRKRYWAICLYRQFMTFLKHDIHLHEKEFKQWVSSYVSTNNEVCLASNSKMGKPSQNASAQDRLFYTWPWRNSFFHAAAQYGSHEVVKVIVSNSSYVKHINSKRGKDGNTAFNLVWYQISTIYEAYKKYRDQILNQKIHENEKGKEAEFKEKISDLKLTEIILYQKEAKFDIPNFKKESANKWISSIENSKSRSAAWTKIDKLTNLENLVSLTNPFFLFFDPI